MMVRHGESTANVSGIISSDPAISTVEHGLTARGAEQVAEEVAQWSRTLPPNQPVVVISSDFTRARETAAIIHKRLRVRHPLMLHTQLRERYFGDWNGLGAENYERVWEADARSADHTQRKVESVHSVVRRSTQLIHEIETRLVDMMRAHLDSLSSSSDGLSSDSAAAAASARRMSHSLEAGSVPRYSVILVAHGDVCQILATAFANMDHRLHRSLPHWNNGEMRVLQWTPTQAQQQQQQNAQNAQPAQPQTSPVVSASASSHAA
jgi:probable phosphoglycerate mutase